MLTLEVSVLCLLSAHVQQLVEMGQGVTAKISWNVSDWIWTGDPSSRVELFTVTSPFPHWSSSCHIVFCIYLQNTIWQLESVPHIYYTIPQTIQPHAACYLGFVSVVWSIAPPHSRCPSGVYSHSTTNGWPWSCTCQDDTSSQTMLRNVPQLKYMGTLDIAHLYRWLWQHFPSLEIACCVIYGIMIQ